jgi:colanic acid/amylovoran biosynthesis glycosyltransferase
VVRTVVPAVGFVERVVPTDGAVKFVQASRLIAKKGLVTTLRAFARVDLPKAELVIAGTGPMEGELRALAVALGVAERVRFLGFLDQKRLREVFAEAHVFLHPSEAVAGDTEGVPNALLEAMASGLPVVATRHGGIPEVIVDGENGLLCDEGDAAGVVAAALRLVADGELYARVARAGAATVRERYSETALATALAEIYGGEDLNQGHRSGLTVRECFRRLRLD